MVDKSNSVLRFGSVLGKVNSVSPASLEFLYTFIHRYATTFGNLETMTGALDSSRLLSKSRARTYPARSMVRSGRTAAA